MQPPLEMTTFIHIYSVKSFRTASLAFIVWKDASTYTSIKVKKYAKMLVVKKIVNKKYEENLRTKL